MKCDKTCVHNKLFCPCLIELHIYFHCFCIILTVMAMTCVKHWALLLLSQKAACPVQSFRVTALAYLHRHRNDFSVGEAKSWWKQSRQSNSKYNFTQYVFFEKGIRSVQWGLRQSPRNWGIFENFCVKSNLTVVWLLFTVCYRKNWGSRMY